MTISKRRRPAMTDELVRRLRERANPKERDSIECEAADRIEALEKALREADALLADDLRVLARERIQRALEAK